MGFYFAQFLTGLASASALFLVACGLSIIFGVTRIVNFAHGSFYMIGAYVAYSLVNWLPWGPAGFWASVLLAAVVVGVVGAAIEFLLLRHLYRSPELFQLVATFGVVLIIQDAAQAIWGPEDLVGPRAPGLDSIVRLWGEPIPEYDLALIVIGGAPSTEDFTAEMRRQQQEDRFHESYYCPFVMVYDTTTDRWHRMPSVMPVPTNDIRVVIRQKRLYALGGENIEPATSNTTRFLRIGELVVM